MYKFTRMTYSHPLDDGQLSPPRRLPLLCDCFLSDGGFDVNKYLQRQTAVCQQLLWRTLTALNLTNVVGEFLLAVGGIFDMVNPLLCGRFHICTLPIPTHVSNKYIRLMKNKLVHCKVGGMRIYQN